MTTPYALFDLHCDTLTAFMDAGPDTLEGLKDPARRGDCLAALTACAQRADTLNDPRRQFALCKIPREVRWAQARWMSSPVRQGSTRAPSAPICR